MSCNLAEILERFERTCCIHFQGGRIHFSDGSAAFFHCRRVVICLLKVEVVSSFSMKILLFLRTMHCVTAETSPHLHHFENLRTFSKCWQLSSKL